MSSSFPSPTAPNYRSPYLNYPNAGVQRPMLTRTSMGAPYGNFNRPGVGWAQPVGSPMQQPGYISPTRLTAQPQTAAPVFSQQAPVAEGGSNMWKWILGATAAAAGGYGVYHLMGNKKPEQTGETGKPATGGEEGKAPVDANQSSTAAAASNTTDETTAKTTHTASPDVQPDPKTSQVLDEVETVSKKAESAVKAGEETIAKDVVVAPAATLKATKKATVKAAEKTAEKAASKASRTWGQFAVDAAKSRPGMATALGLGAFALERYLAPGLLYNNLAVHELPRLVSLLPNAVQLPLGRAIPWLSNGVCSAAGGQPLYYTGAVAVGSAIPVAKEAIQGAVHSLGNVSVKESLGNLGKAVSNKGAEAIAGAGRAYQMAADGVGYVFGTAANSTSRNIDALRQNAGYAYELASNTTRDSIPVAGEALGNVTSSVLNTGENVLGVGKNLTGNLWNNFWGYFNPGNATNANHTVVANLEDVLKSNATTTQYSVKGFIDGFSHLFSSGAKLAENATNANHTVAANLSELVGNTTNTTSYGIIDRFLNLFSSAKNVTHP